MSKKVGATAVIVECDVVLFDMDGTLVDSTAVVERTWTRWASRLGIDVADVLAVSHGRPSLDTLRLVAPHLATPEEAARIDAAEACDSDDLRPIPGARELLSSLPRTRWAVVTSADRQLAASRLSAAGLPLPEVLVSVEDLPRGKPDPSPYLHAARLLSSTADRAIVLEDTPVGVQAGRAAGATVIGLTTTFTALDGCDYTVPDLRAVRVLEVREGRVRLEVVAAMEQCLPSRITGS
jgi:mannitol-1-/sugar-/sorbitol-6-phosphatase